MSWQELLNLGKSESDLHLEERLRDMAINMCALLVYTSGTTGNPKGYIYRVIYYPATFYSI